MIYNDFSVAWEKTSANKQRIYARTSGDGRSGFERAIGRPFPAITIRPKFKLDPLAPVFTIGSCFAREVENSISKRGFDCITKRCIIEDEYYETNGIGARNGALNAYTTHSMLSLLTLNGREDREVAGTLQIGDDLWVDMLLSGLRPVSLEKMRTVRNKVLATYAEIAKAGTVVITLGYTETWFDDLDMIFVNRSPAASRATLKHGGRFKFANAEAADVTNALVDIVSAVKAQTSEGIKIILTTSPIPLHATFTDRDVICANMYSKSTLLSAAVAVAAKYDFVDYYPSFEMATLSSPDQSWTEDGVHVKPSLVDKILAQFFESYT